jgi:hypothetical protein
LGGPGGSPLAPNMSARIESGFGLVLTGGPTPEAPAAGLIAISPTMTRSIANIVRTFSSFLVVPPKAGLSGGLRSSCALGSILPTSRRLRLGRLAHRGGNGQDCESPKCTIYAGISWIENARLRRCEKRLQLWGRHQPSGLRPSWPGTSSLTYDARQSPHHGGNPP